MLKSIGLRGQGLHVAWARCLRRQMATMASERPPRRTCLWDFHRDRQARMESFAGYSMPIVYKDQTIRQEHLQTRTQATAFDVSHMMQTIVRGRDRHKFLEALTVADLSGLRLNKCALSVLTNERGGIVDDCIIARREDHLHMVSNAGNAETVWAWLKENQARGEFAHSVQLERLEGRGLVALQGPRAAEVLQALIAGTPGMRLSELEFMATTTAELVAGAGECLITRCGYTGEDGFEISVAPERARPLMEALCAHSHVLPAGLGARDTLRLEAGLCLHGHDITPDTTPVEAALAWVVAKRRRAEGGFPGHQVIVRQLREGAPLRRLGLVARGPGPPAREGSQVRAAASGELLGRVTSGTFAPSLGKNIAMAYLPAGLAAKAAATGGGGGPEAALVCEVRGRAYEYELAKMPFVKSNYYVKK